MPTVSLREYDRIVADKDAELESLHDQLLPGGNGTENPGSKGGHSEPLVRRGQGLETGQAVGRRSRRGKAPAPPVDPYTRDAAR